MARQGYIKLHRSLVDHEIYSSDPTAAFLFITLLMLVDSDTGSYDGGRHMLAKRLKLKPTTCYQALKRLERCTMVELSVNARYTQITVVNWHLYQRSMNAQRTPDDTNKEKERYIGSTNVEPSSTQVDNQALFYQLVKLLGFTEQVQYTPERQKKLKLRLRRYSHDQLRQAAKTIGGDPFLQGDNDRGVRYGTIDYLLRNDEGVDRRLEEQSTSNVDLTKLEVPA